MYNTKNVQETSEKLKYEYYHFSNIGTMNIFEIIVLKEKKANEQKIKKYDLEKNHHHQVCEYLYSKIKISKKTYRFIAIFLISVK